MPIIQQPYAQYVYNDRFTVVWEEYINNDYKETQIHIGVPGFTPSPSSLYKTITEQQIIYCEVLGRIKLKEYESIIRVVKSDNSYEDSNNVHIITADDNECQILHDGTIYGAWGQLADTEQGNINSYVLATYGHNLTPPVGLDLNFHYRMVSYNHIPFFKIEKFPTKENVFAQQRAVDIEGQYNPVLFLSGFNYVFSDDAEGLIWDYSKKKPYWTPPVDSNYSYLGFGNPVVLEDGSWLLSGARRNYTIYPTINLVTDSLILRVVFDENGDLYAPDPPVVAKASDKEFFGYYGMSAVKITYDDPEDSRNFYPNEHIIGIARTNDCTDIIYQYAEEPWGHVPMLESFDSGKNWSYTPTNIQISGWMTPILLWHKEQRRLYLYEGFRSNINAYNPRTGNYLFWNDDLTANGWSELQVTNDGSLNGGNPSHVINFGEGTITFIKEKEEIWINYYRTVGVPLAEAEGFSIPGTSNPYQGFKIIDISGTTPTIKVMPKYSYETDPYRIVISTPIITQQNSQLTGTISTNGLLLTEIPIFFYSTITPNQNSTQMPTVVDLGNGGWQSIMDFSGMCGNFYFRVGVQRDGVWYFSETTQFEILEPTITSTIEPSPLSLQLFGTYNINSTGTKKIGYIKLNSSNTQTGDIVYLEHSTNQSQWTQIQLSEIPNNKYCKINLYGDIKYYFRFSVLQGTDYFYSDIITSDEFYQSPTFNNLSYIKVTQYNYIWLTCNIDILYDNENIVYQMSQDQNTWTDLPIKYQNNDVYRTWFLLDDISGEWFYRVKLNRIDETFYSDIANFNLDLMVVKNTDGYNPYAPKNPVTYNSSILKGFKLGSLKLGKVFKESSDIAKLGSFKISSKVLGSFIQIDITMKCDVNFIRFWSNQVEFSTVYSLLQYYSNLCSVEINYNLVKVEVFKILAQIEPELNIQFDHVKDIKIKCKTHPEVTLESLINKDHQLSSDMKFDIEIESM